MSTGHFLHAVTELLPSAVYTLTWSWYWPAGQASGVERPLGQRLPTVHGVAAVPLPGQKKPAGHLPAQSEFVWCSLALEPK